MHRFVRGASSVRTALFACLVFLVAATLVLAALPGTDFEAADGNMVADDLTQPPDGTPDERDWENLDEASGLVVKIEADSGQDDDSFGNGTKADTVDPAVNTGSIPGNKSDLTRFYVYTEKRPAASEPAGVDHDFVYLGWERENTLGSANISFEFNQLQELQCSASSCDNGLDDDGDGETDETDAFTGLCRDCVVDCTDGVDTDGDGDVDEMSDEGLCLDGLKVLKVRTRDDLLINYDFSQGGEVATITSSQWVDGSDPADDCESNGSSPPCWGPASNLTEMAAAEAQINETAIYEPFLDTTIPERTFGEAAIDMTAAGIFDDECNCLAFGSVMVSSRSSDSFSSAMKDLVSPVDVEVSNCGRITVTKVTDPAEAEPESGDDQRPSFTFDSSGASDCPGAAGLVPSTESIRHGETISYRTDGESGVLKSVLGGYTVVESEPIPAEGEPDFDLVDIDCSVSGSDTSVSIGDSAGGAADGDFDEGDDQIEISLGVGGAVDCTFTNRQRGRIVVQKQTDPADSTEAFGFDASWLGTNPGGGEDDFSVMGGNSWTSAYLRPAADAGGNYSVSENTPAGWELADIDGDGVAADCSSDLRAGSLDPSSIDLRPAETVTCTFENREQGTIIVQKQTDPEGDTTLFDFSAGYDPDGFSLSDGQSDDSGYLSPGTWSVSESTPEGWELISATCDDGSDPSSIDLQAGETVTCTFTNEKDAFIVVRKETDPAGDPAAFSFTADYEDEGFSLSDGEQHDSGSLDPGTYSVSESTPEGWELISATCDDGSDPSSIDLQAGETVTCTFTNEKDAFIVVEKQTDPAGDPQLFTFSPSYGSDFELADGGEHDSGDLDPGTYSVSETVPEGWEQESVSCTSSNGDSESAGSIDLQAGETVTCTFINEKDAFIVVEKQTDPAGDPQLFTFSRSYGSDFELADGGEHDSGDLDPGTYSVAEADAGAGWDLTSATCSDGSDPASIDLQAGETVTCTFTNTKRGRFTIVKKDDDDAPEFMDGVVFTLWEDVDPDDGDVAHDEAEDVETSLSCTTDSGGECTIENVPLGLYWLVETPLDGYTPRPDDYFDVAAGFDESLEFTNKRQFRVLVVICKENGNTLHPSQVRLNDGTWVDSLAPADLTDGLTEEQVCTLAAASFDDREFTPCGESDCTNGVDDDGDTLIDEFEPMESLDVRIPQ